MRLAWALTASLVFCLFVRAVGLDMPTQSLAALDGLLLVVLYPPGGGGCPVV